jgi:hypothetical protein
LLHGGAKPFFVRDCQPTDKIFEYINATRYSDLFYKLSYVTVKFKDHERKIEIGGKLEIKQEEIKEKILKEL